MVAGAILCLELVETKVRCLFTKILHTFSYHLAMHFFLKVDLLHTFLVFLLGKLLIKEAVLLLVKPNTSNAVAATEAVKAELAVTAVLTVLAVVRTVATIAVHTFCAPLTVGTECDAAAAHALS
tara:strand:+ start:326 stop:697 length:372 start_codon:yes stop_codon:yes gene_type:complete